MTTIDENYEKYLESFEHYLDFIKEQEDIFDKDTRKCRLCGCTQYNACPGGCYWVTDDLCSKCAAKVTKKGGN